MPPLLPPDGPDRRTRSCHHARLQAAAGDSGAGNLVPSPWERNRWDRARTPDQCTPSAWVFRQVLRLREAWRAHEWTPGKAAPLKPQQISGNPRRCLRLHCCLVSMECPLPFGCAKHTDCSSALPIRRCSQKSEMTPVLSAKASVATPKRCSMVTKRFDSGRSSPVAWIFHGSVSPGAQPPRYAFAPA